MNIDLKEIPMEEAEYLMDCKELTERQKNYVSNEVYTSKGLKNVLMLNKPKIWAGIKKKMYSNCQKCQRLTLLKNLYSRVDGNNIAITKNSQNVCNKCLNL